MTEFLLEKITSSIYLRPMISILILVTMLLLEQVIPRRTMTSSISYRWKINLGLAFLNYIILKLLAIDLNIYAAKSALFYKWGLLNLFPLTSWGKTLLTVVLLDMLIYFQHLVFHRIPILWQLHQVHHCDSDFDTTTAVRFHPVEILLSMIIKFVFIVFIGADPLGVILFEIILNGCALFNHGNIYIPQPIDNFLKLFLVTPDMHRIHHSVEINESNSNYGFSVSLWDRIFKTYTRIGKKSQLEMEFGVKPYPTPFNFSFFKIIEMPFKKLE